MLSCCPFGEDRLLKMESTSMLFPKFKETGVKYMVMEEGVTLGDRCTMQYTDDVS